MLKSIGAQIENDDDTSLIYKALKERLEEITASLDVPDVLLPGNHSHNKDYQIIFQCICVIYIDDSMIIEESSPAEKNIKYQTFRIKPDTTVDDVINASLFLFDRLSDRNLFSLFLYEDKKPLNKDEKIHNILLSNKNTVRLAQFVLKTKSSVFSYEDFDDNVNNEKDANVIVKKFRIKDDKYTNFISGFAGMRNYINYKYHKMIDKEFENKSKFKEIKTKANFSIMDIVIKGLTYLIFFLFFVFSLLAITQHKNPLMMYHNFLTLRKTFFLNYIQDHNTLSQIGDEDSVIAAIESIIDCFSYDNNSGNNFKMINMMRFTFYKSNEKTCDTNLLNFSTDTPLCYDKPYTEVISAHHSNAEYYSYFTDGKYKTDSEICSNINEYFVLKADTINENYISTCDDLNEYLTDVFKSFQTDNYIVDNLNLEGDFGVYKGQQSEDLNTHNSVDIFLNVNTMTTKTTMNILKILQKNSMFNINTQKAVTISFAVYSFISRCYIYIGILIENNETGAQFKTFKFIPFYMNMKDTEHGTMIYVMDIFRLIFSIALFIIAIKSAYDKITIKINKKVSSLLMEILNIVISLELILDVLIFAMYIVVFVNKSKYLYNDVKHNEMIATNNYYHLNAKEYYPIANAYEMISIYEGIITILILLRLISYLQIIKRIKTVIEFITLSLKKSLMYFIIFIILILFFSIYVNLLLGNHIESFAFYSSSFLLTLSLSISHISKGIFNASENYIVVLIFLFFVVIIFFTINAFTGVYIECYRLTALRKGNIFDSRISKEIRKAEQREEQMKINATANTFGSNKDSSKMNIINNKY